jgi:hypothetical protein
LFSKIILFALVSFLLIPLQAAGDETHDDGSHAGDKHSAGYMRGQRLFYGLVDGKFEGMACADCHNTVEIDTFNWNPNAWEIAHKYKNKSSAEFSKAVLNPTGRTMSVVHQSFNLTEADAEMIKEFLDLFEEDGLATKKPVINKILLFLLLGAVLTWIVADVVFIKRVKKKWILGVVFLGAFGWQVYLMLDAGIALGRQENYEPDQPIKFSHAIHVTDNHIDCQYCHHTVESSKSAGFPSAALCMNCHIIVREGTNSGRHEISKLVSAYENNEPIEWIRIHNLQDHAFFSHAQHVGVGGIECQDCHGPIEEMHRVYQFSDLSMGWCINCHRETEVQFFDNAFYSKYEDIQSALKAGEIEKVTAETVGGTECSKCHY